MSKESAGACVEEVSKSSPKAVPKSLVAVVEVGAGAYGSMESSSVELGLAFSSSDGGGELHNQDIFCQVDEM